MAILAEFLLVFVITSAQIQCGTRLALISPHAADQDLVLLLSLSLIFVPVRILVLRY